MYSQSDTINNILKHCGYSDHQIRSMGVDNRKKYNEISKTLNKKLLEDQNGGGLKELLNDKRLERKWKKNIQSFKRDVQRIVQRIVNNQISRSDKERAIRLNERLKGIKQPIVEYGHRKLHPEYNKITRELTDIYKKYTDVFSREDHTMVYLMLKFLRKNNIDLVCAGESCNEVLSTWVTERAESLTSWSYEEAYRRLLQNKYYCC